MPAGTVTDTAWDEAVLLEGQIVIVAICASGTGPCQSFGPTVDAIATDLAGTATVLTIDLEENPAVGRLTGARSKARLLRELRPYLG